MCQVLEVPGYRELAQLDWLVKIAHLCLKKTSELVGVVNCGPFLKNLPSKNFMNIYKKIFFRRSKRQYERLKSSTLWSLTLPYQKNTLQPMVKSIYYYYVIIKIL
jgi:hypothetical protein